MLKKMQANISSCGILEYKDDTYMVKKSALSGKLCILLSSLGSDFDIARNIR